MPRGKTWVGALAICLALVGLLPSAAGAATPSITDAFNKGAGNGDQDFSIAEDCPIKPSEDGGRRICSGDVPSFDGVTLDVDLTVPKNAGGSRHPLMVMLHGFGQDKHYWESTTDEGDGRDLWHWNNHWFSKHGYYVLTHTARGFESSQSDGDRPDTPPDSSSIFDATAPSPKDPTDATIRLKTREFEIRDTQWLSALVAAEFDVDGDKVGVTGDSYGGGESWTQASQAQWTFPNDCTNPNKALRPRLPASCRTQEFDEQLPPLELQVAVPKYPWTDVAYGLLPNGRPNPDNGSLYESSQGRSSSYTGDGSPVGVPKMSWTELLYAVGSKPRNAFEKGASDCAATEENCYSIDAWHARGAAGEPYEAAGGEVGFFPGGIVPPGAPTAPFQNADDPIMKQLRRGLTEFRSAYYQDRLFASGAGVPSSEGDRATQGFEAQRDGRKVAIFSIEGWTDDLFTAVESFRQFKYLKRLDPRWPVEVELASIGHARAQNKPATWRRLNNQAFQFVVAHIQGSHEQQTTVASEQTVCANDGEPDNNLNAAQRLTAQTPEGLSSGRLSIQYARPDTLLWTSGLDDPNGPATDPVSGFALEQLVGAEGGCRTSPGRPPEDSYSAESPPLKDDSTYVGLGHVNLRNYKFVGLSGQLNARVWDVPPDGSDPTLITRGTYRLRNQADALPPATITAL